MWHVLYLSYESEGRDYIGAHSTEDLYDGYLGSYSDSSFSPDNRIIVGYYKSRDSLLQAEESLQTSLNVAKDPQYANRSIQTSSGFNRQGVPDTECTRRKKSRAHTGKTRSASQVQAMTEAQNRPEVKEKKSISLAGDNNPAKRTEVRQKLSEKMTGEGNPRFGKPGTLLGVTGESHPSYGRVKSPEFKQNLSEKHSGDNNPCFGKRWWVNSKNQTAYQTQSLGPEWQPGRKWKPQ